MVAICHHTHLSKPTECTIPGMNPNINYGLWVIIMCHCRFIDYKRCTTLVQNVDCGGGCACMGSGGTQELSVLLAQFCCEHKTALKIKDI